jgi:hypothetical protein
VVASLLFSRIQRIRMGYCVLRDILVTLGVPQGCHFGLLCFTWFENEIAQIFEYVQVLFYADDMKLFLPIRGFHDCLKIQCDLNRLVD